MVNWRRQAAIVAALVVMVGCADGSGNEAPAASSPTQQGSVQSSPFRVGAVPEGYDVVTAGVGTQEGPIWGEDCCGTQEPFTVLSPDGSAGHPESVIVSTTGFAGYQGELGQASPGYAGDKWDDTPVGDRNALYFPGEPNADGTAGETRSDLVVQVDDDLGVRVTAPDASRAALVAVFEQTSWSEDHLEPPSVAEPPDGMEVVGSVSPELEMVAFGPVMANSDQTPGSERTHSIGYSNGDLDLRVASLPGSVVDVDAAASFFDAGWRGAGGQVAFDSVRGRRSVALTYESESSLERATISETPNGDVLVISQFSSTRPGFSGTVPTPLTTDDMHALAATAEPVSQEAWDEFVIEATGGPGLHPDDGSVELARGETGDLEWLLQSIGTNADWRVNAGDGETADPCLKVSTRKRACAGGGWTSGDGTAMQTSGSGPGADLEGLPPFMIVTADVAGATVRVTHDDEVTTGHMAELPGGERSAGVVFVDIDEAKPSCRDEPLPPELAEIDTVRVEVLDVDGRVLDCVGLE